MGIDMDTLVNRLNESLNDMERHNYGDAAKRLANTISIIFELGIEVIARPTVQNEGSAENER